MSSLVYYVIGKKDKAWESLVTNESLEAITAGLNPQPEDFILAICGSGDQAFALLEGANNITLVDNRNCQIGYFLKRKNLLEAGEFEKFLNPGQEPRDNQDGLDLKFRNEYFSIKRLKRIQSKLKDSEIKTIFGDIFSLRFTKEKFNKIYLSNALSYGHLCGNVHIETIEERLRLISEELAKGGMMYISDAKHVIQQSILYYAEDENSFFNPLGFKINLKLTATSQRLQAKAKHWTSWRPAVLQKVY